MSAVEELVKHCTERVLERLDHVVRDLGLLRQERTVKDWYTTAEIAVIVGRAEFTVREWCRNDRIYAQKRLCGRGNSLDWIISHAELIRYQNEGLLPIRKN